MRHGRMRIGALSAALASAALVLSACGGGGAAAGGGGGSLGAIDLSGATFTVGSKEFTEQIVLGQIAVQALEATGASVKPLTSITGTTNVRTALTSGSIDMYWEYTGTGWSTHLKREVSQAPKDPVQLYDQVKQGDAANGVEWLAMSPLNNSYAMGISEAKANELNVKSLSQFATYAQANPTTKICAASEFLTRDDGLPGVAKTYGFAVPSGGVTELELSLVPPQIAQAQNCLIGEITTTDGAVSANKLLVLMDDKKAFFDYNAAMTVRQQVLQANPKLADVFNPIATKLTTDEVRKLNERVDVGGELPEDVAKDWLKTNGFIA